MARRPAAGDEHHGGADRSHVLDGGDLQVLVARPRRDLPVQARRQGLGHMRLREDVHRAAAGLAHVQGARKGSRRHSRPVALAAHVESRHRRTQHHGHVRPEGFDGCEVGDLLLLLLRERSGLRVPTRRRRLAGLRLAEVLQRPQEGRARLPRPIRRRGRKRRQDPGHVELVRPLMENG